MQGLNKVYLLGALGKDPELKYTSSGTAVANFSVATSSSYKDKSGDLKENTTWHNIVAWGKTAETCGKYLHKGSKIHIEGRIDNRSWDKDGGGKGYISEVVVDRIIFLTPKDESQGSTRGSGSPQDLAQGGPGAGNYTPEFPAGDNLLQDDTDLPF